MEKVRYEVLIIGAGKIGAFFDKPGDKMTLSYAHAFTEDERFHLKGFYDVDYKKTLQAAECWNCGAYQDLGEAMEGVEIACCCVPDEFHESLLEQLAPYPLLLTITEKPLAKSVEAAQRIGELYGAKKPLALNYSRRFLKEFQALRQERKGYGAFLKGTGYYGKGVTHNGSHMLDILAFLLDSPLEVEAVSHPICDFSGGDQSCDVALKAAGGFFHMAAIDCRVATIFEMDLFFQKARVRILDGGSKIEIYTVQESPTYEGYYNYILSETRYIDYSNAMKGLLDNIKQYLDGREALYCSVEDGVDVLQVCGKVKGWRG